MRRAGISLLLIVLTGCLATLFESLPEEPPFPTGASFTYISTTYRNDTLQIGTIAVVAADSGRFTGTWELAWPAGADSTRYPGLPNGRGSVVGVTTGAEAFIDLIDADSLGRILLHAYADTSGWRGSWNYQRDSVSRRGGVFTARMLP